MWRISNYADLSGLGGLRASGRWHTRGKRIVYLADHPASALLEMLVHMDRDLLPASYRLLRVVVPETIAIERMDADALRQDWRDYPATTRDLGDQWLDRASSALLQVPSVIVPQAWNVLLNPAHPGAGAITIAEIIEAPFDPRLLPEG
ncbi:RES domain-containing protein [Rhodopseudomonas rhenobacensis]|uniref:RES domain-containing protein n=1 Tax=Rhodopseudomonas rhenobacensis TaxID=87461 RepID=A0A7W7Z8P0_9BRAD|nr:RES domain-containing protein [Rhodopseudomonas rhenobacensis]